MIVLHGRVSEHTIMIMIVSEAYIYSAYSLQCTVHTVICLNIYIRAVEAYDSTAEHNCNFLLVIVDCHCRRIGVRSL